MIPEEKLWKVTPLYRASSKTVPLHKSEKYAPGSGCENFEIYFPMDTLIVSSCITEGFSVGPTCGVTLNLVRVMSVARRFARY